MRASKSFITVGALALVAAGCGSSSVTAKERIDGCLKKQPDSTEADCKGWEKDGKLQDDGTHRDHKG